MRHAEAAWPQGVDDHDRPLTEQGVEDAKDIGRRLAAGGLQPRRVLASTAARAAETGRLVAAATGAPMDLEASLYGAPAHRYLDAADDPGVLLVGHDPGIGKAIGSLLGDDGFTCHAGTCAVFDPGEDAPRLVALLRPVRPA